MNVSKISGMVIGTIALLGFAVQPAAATGALAGQGLLTFDFCPPGSDRTTITGVEDGGLWTVVVTDHHEDVCSIIADVNVYEGSWNPAVGHDLAFFTDCMPGTLGGFLCLGPVPATATVTFTPMFICMPIALCMGGQATLVRA